MDIGDADAIYDHTEALELVIGGCDYPALRAKALLGIQVILATKAAPVEAAPLPDPPKLSFVSGAAALLDAIARRKGEPEAALPLAAAAGA